MRVQRSLSGAGSSGALSPAPSSNGVSASELAFPAFPSPPPGSAFMSTYSMDVAAIEPEPEKPVSVTQSLDEEEDESTIYLGSPKVRAGLAGQGLWTLGCRLSCQWVLAVCHGCRGTRHGMIGKLRGCSWARFRVRACSRR